jgi:hypothetical protein
MGARIPLSKRQQGLIAFIPLSLHTSRRKMKNLRDLRASGYEPHYYSAVDDCDRIVAKFRREKAKMGIFDVQCPSHGTWLPAADRGGSF